jgi:peptidoglycan/LPS O-acetylase OafA/YrhL
LNSATHRIDSLDGLRGVAAFIVVVHHSLMPSPSFAGIVTGAAPSGAVQWLLTYTPLRIVWAGREAVWVFFVLSGFVLVRPYVSERRLDTGRYYLRRFVRLYLPVFASYVFARALRVVPREPDPSHTWWIAGHVPAVGIEDSVRTMSLVVGNHITLDLVWWSLQWEVWFSILVPLVVVVVRRTRRHGMLLVMFFVAASAAGRTFADDPTWSSVRLMQAPFYLSMFGVGAGLTLLEDPIRRRLAHLGVTGSAAFVLVSISLLTMPAAVEALIPSNGAGHAVGLAASGAIGVTGAAACLTAALTLPAVVRTLTRRPIHWLGVRSFSLYLIHDPIIAAIVFAFGLSTVTWWSLPLGIVISVVVAGVFYELVEAPTLELLRRIPRNRPARTSPAT